MQGGTGDTSKVDQPHFRHVMRKKLEYIVITRTLGGKKRQGKKTRTHCDKNIGRRREIGEENWNKL